MKPLFTIHEGEFLVGDHINRRGCANFLFRCVKFSPERGVLSRYRISSGDALI